jgi:hypothetical protein
VIADLSANYVERKVLEAGFVLERPRSDYGIDGQLYTFDGNSFQENGYSSFQFKATDNPANYKVAGGFSYPVKVGHLKHWLADAYPVYLVLYLALEDRAYWTSIREYFKSSGTSPSSLKGKTHAVFIPESQKITRRTPVRWQQEKNVLVKKYAEEVGL